MPRVVHFEVHCDDLDRAERFYRDVFSWRVQRFEGPYDYRLVHTGEASEPGIDGALLQRRGPIDGQAVIAYVCTIAVADLSATHEQVLAAGGTLALERMVVPGVGHLAYYKDTEGNIFGAIQNDPLAGAS